MNSLPITNEKVSEKISWNKQDTQWTLVLFGTAIGAGVLFLPINAGLGGIVTLFILMALAFPVTYFPHQAMARLILSGSQKGMNLIEVSTEHFGNKIGSIIAFGYFIAIYPILLIYSVALTNTVESFMVYQLEITPPPKIILSLVLISTIIAIVSLGQDLIIKIMSLLVYPFVFSLLGLAVYLIPEWNVAVLMTDLQFSVSMLTNIWLLIPMMVFSFSHTPIMSSFTVAQKNRYGEKADKKCSQILASAHTLMMFVVVFFVISCVLSLSPANLAEAKDQNISILTYLSTHFDNKFIAFAAPIIAFVAITKSFLGTYLGASEGVSAVTSDILDKFNINLSSITLNKFSTIFILLTCWITAASNPSILGIISSLGAPIIAMLLFILPMWAIYTVPSMAQYRGKVTNIFVIVIGLVAMSGIFYVMIGA